MNADDPIAFFITWTVYGTHLQGDEVGWHRWGKGEQEPRPALTIWRKERLKHSVLLLTREQRDVVEQECRRHCEHRDWQAWAVNARTNHCHAVITANNYSGDAVRDQLKANCTRRLREQWPTLQDRPVWTVGGDWKCINTDHDLETVCKYVREAQDRKDRDSH